MSDTEAPDKTKSRELMTRFRSEFLRALPGIEKLLPAHIKRDKFEAVVMTAITLNPDLLSVSRRSLFNACRAAAELGLSLNPALAEADILIQYDKRAGGKVARFSPRFGGLMKLGRQSGKIRTIYAHTVRENDTYEVDLGSDKRISHKPASSNRGNLIAVYCVWVLEDGTKDFEVMDKEQVMAVRARSSAKKQDGTVVGPWVTDEEEMWRKTVVRRASKYWPRSAELSSMLRATAGEDVELDGAAIDENAMASDLSDALDVTATGGEGDDFLDAGPGEPEDDAPPTQEKAGAAQMAGLEARLTPKQAAPTPAPAQPPQANPAPATANKKRARVIPVPQVNDAPDWIGYARAIMLALSEAQAEDMKRIVASNSVAMNNLKAARPDLHGGIMQFVEISKPAEGGEE